MNNDYIAVWDSGIGGLSVLKQLVKAMPNEKFLYFGDNNNAPYGSKTLRELKSIVIENVTYIKSFGIKALVVACNTLSLNLLDMIKDFANIPTFGVFPPINLFMKERALLIATPLTIKRFDECYGKIKGLDTLALPNLASEIENNLYNVEINKHIDVGCVDYQTVILGCTHYFFVKKSIIDHLKPRKIISGNEFTVLTIKNYLQINKNIQTLVKNWKNQIKFVGKTADVNKQFWKLVVNNYEIN